MFRVFEVLERELGGHISPQRLKPPRNLTILAVRLEAAPLQSTASSTVSKHGLSTLGWRRAGYSA